MQRGVPRYAYVLVALLGALPVGCHALPDATDGVHWPPPCPPEGCGAGQICAQVTRAGQVYDTCLLRCDPTGADLCPDGSTCVPSSGSGLHGFCSLGCRDDSDCATRHCDAQTKLCHCVSDAQCNDLADTVFFNFACTDSGRCTIACTADDDCSCGNVCSNGECTVGCSVDEDCCGGGYCVGGRCSVAQGPLGAACYDDADCAGELLCDSNRYRRGMCLGPTYTGCAGVPCPADTTCIAVRSINDDRIAGKCAPTCQTPADCRGGAVCAAATGLPRNVPACAPPCESDAVCGPGAFCSPTTGTCGCQDDSACKLFGKAAVCDTASGECACIPSCDGKSCGTDGCGGSCGVCADGLNCVEGTCAGSCGGEARYTTCNDGTLCPPGSSCTTDNRCQCPRGQRSTTCAGTPCDECAWEWKCSACGAIDCGGNCGDCPDGYVCQSEQCVKTGATGGGSQPPATNCGGCGGSDVCVNVAGTPTCLARCDGSCSTCCLTTSTGAQVCSPNSNACQPPSGGGGSPEQCHSKNGCVSVSVKWPTTGLCSDSLAVTATNNCNEPVKMVVKPIGCSDLPGSSGLPAGSSWTCATGNYYSAACTGVSFIAAAATDPDSCIY